jgi:hypothetical protein
VSNVIPFRPRAVIARKVFQGYDIQFPNVDRDYAEFERQRWRLVGLLSARRGTQTEQFFAEHFGPGVMP